MGQHASKPRPGTELRVIGVGLPRTGTASFSKALEILLEAPVYHGSTQCTLGPEADIKAWNEVLRLYPARTPEAKRRTHELILSRLDGYVASVDAPMSNLLPEMVELYPNAKFICTVRDPDIWQKSMAKISYACLFPLLRIILLSLPSLRYFPAFVVEMGRMYIDLYGEHQLPLTRQTWDRHMEMVMRVVPQDQLIFFNVQDGWAPLCKALGKDIPEGVPFPCINDSDAIEQFKNKHIKRGLMKWAQIIIVVFASYWIMSTVKNCAS